MSQAKYSVANQAGLFLAQLEMKCIVHLLEPSLQFHGSAKKVSLAPALISAQRLGNGLWKVLREDRKCGKPQL